MLPSVRSSSVETEKLYNIFKRMTALPAENEILKNRCREWAYLHIRSMILQNEFKHQQKEALHCLFGLNSFAFNQELSKFMAKDVLEKILKMTPEELTSPSVCESISLLYSTLDEFQIIEKYVEACVDHSIFSDLLETILCDELFFSTFSFTTKIK